MAIRLQSLPQLNTEWLRCWRQLGRRYSLDPVASHYGALGQLLEPSLPEAHFQDAFLHWETDAARWHRDTGALLPDTVKIGT